MTFKKGATLSDIQTEKPNFFFFSQHCAPSTPFISEVIILCMSTDVIRHLTVFFSFVFGQFKVCRALALAVWLPFFIGTAADGVSLFLTVVCCCDAHSLCCVCTLLNGSIAPYTVQVLKFSGFNTYLLFVCVWGGSFPVWCLLTFCA